MYLWHSLESKYLYEILSRETVSHRAQIILAPSTKGMSRVASGEVFEAEELLEKVESWSEEEIEELPKLYREKAREFRRLTNSGDG